MSSRTFQTFFLLPFFSIFLLLLHVTAADTQSPSPYYTDIPGVTQEEIDAIERLKRLRPEGLSYVMINSDISFINVNGEINGFTRILCEEIGNLFGTRVTPRLVDWSTLIGGLENREFDLSGELTATPERRKKFRMTTHVLERVFTVFHRSDREDLDLINGKETLRYGFLKGSVNYDRVRETSAVPFAAVFMENVKEAAEALESDTIDAFVSEGRMDSLFDQYPNITYQEYYPLLYSSVALATANPEISPIIDVFQKYLDHGGRSRISEMHAQGEIEYLRYKLLKQLSAEEKSYVEKHVKNGKTIPLVAEPDNYPVSFYNKQEREWQGIAHDIIAEIARITGLEFQIVNQPDAAWFTLLQALKNGNAAMVTELMPTRNREKTFLWPAQPYTTDHYALLSLDETPSISIQQVFNSKVGLIRGSAHEEAFHRVFPDHSNFMVYSNATGGFEALERGEVDLVMMTRNLLLGITIYNERPEFKINVSLDLPSDSYFGFNLNQPLLRGIVDKAQKIVNCEDIADQWKRKSFDYDKKLARVRIPYLISIFALLTAVLTLLLALSKKKESLSRRLSMIDHLTRLPNRRNFDEQIRIDWENSVRDRLSISLLAIDIDHFKRINDTYGHPQGDTVLRAVAKTLLTAAQRHSDLVARVGGEEFSILLTNTDLEGARLVADRVRADIEKTAVDNLTGGPAIKVTASVGVACIRPGPDGSVKDLESRSDRALYTAKQGGRNRVCIA